MSESSYNKKLEREKARYQRLISENPNRNTERNRIYRRNFPEKYLWQMVKARAKTKGFSFTLKECDINIPDICPVLGIPLFFTESVSKNPNSPSVHRLDSSLGYDPDNIDVISWRANDLLRNGSLEEFLKIGKYLNDKKSQKELQERG